MGISANAKDENEDSRNSVNYVEEDFVRRIPQMMRSFLAIAEPMILVQEVVKFCHVATVHLSCIRFFLLNHFHMFPDLIRILKSPEIIFHCQKNATAIET